MDDLPEAVPAGQPANSVLLQLLSLLDQGKHAIEALVLALESIPPIPNDAIVQCVAGLAVAVFRVYEQKCANDAKVGELHRAIAQVSVVLDKHLVPQRRMVATYRDQLKDLTDALKAAGEWVVAYARKSAMSKYFSANKERRQPYR